MQRDEKAASESTLDAVWCVDSQNGDRVLMSRKTGKPIGIWRTDGTQQDL